MSLRYGKPMVPYTVLRLFMRTQNIYAKINWRVFVVNARAGYELLYF